jgi:adenylylsulfate kinase-like enzyme
VNNDINIQHKLVHGTSIWFTGLPSSGKTTIANELSMYLRKKNIPNILFDGDELRPIIAEGDDYSEEGRLHALHKGIQLCNIIIRSEVIAIFAVNLHSEKQRQVARKPYDINQYIEIWVDTPLDICIERDVKGLYQKALKGDIDNLVGVNIQFIPPINYDVRVATANESPEKATERIFKHLLMLKVIIHS